MSLLTNQLDALNELAIKMRQNAIRAQSIREKSKLDVTNDGVLAALADYETGIALEIERIIQMREVE